MVENFPNLLKNSSNTKFLFTMTPTQFTCLEKDTISVTKIIISRDEIPRDLSSLKQGCFPNLDGIRLCISKARAAELCDPIVSAQTSVDFHCIGRVVSSSAQMAMEI